MRIDGKGLIDRDQPVTFTFDGQPVSGFAGDTVASALLGQGTRLMGRSFKYHRPRGPLTACSAEPNALVTVGRGAHQDPNVRATMQAITPGLEVTSQNRWPSLKTDILSVNNLLSPFLSAGFYYKTFMWPKAFWERVYEPFIRKAAGLGALSGEASPDDSESAYAHCDVLVIGAGPAGLMAALTAAEGGADVILADENERPGGRLLSETTTVDDMPGHAWAAAMLERLRATGRVRWMPRSCVVGAYDGGTFAVLEDLRSHLGARPENLPRQCFWRIAARQSILAAGALERPIAFPMNDRPGVMLAGALRSYLNRWGVVAGRKIALFTNNDGAHQTALDLIEAGLECTVIDARPDAKPLGRYTLHAGAEVIHTSGTLGLTDITVRTPRDTLRIPCEVLGVSGGWNPNVSLTCHMGGRPTWNPEIAAFVPTPGSVPGMQAAGAALGNFSTHGALKSGVFRARKALEALGAKPPSIPVPQAEDAPLNAAPLWAVEAKGRAWLDFQNDVTTKDIRQAARENYASVEHMKRYTTQGMATDQGKNSNVQALAILADATGRGIPETGTTTYRPPYMPVPIEAMGAGGKHKGFAPERFTTSHGASAERGAPFIEAGLWYRPSYFPRPGEVTWRESCDREVTMVRSHVGVADVSTLGKIDIQGPGAGALLDLVYTNMFSTLKVGRVRYGLMLREDGHIMDDGTTARLGENHYVMTTTTAAAGPVMRHLEFVTQVLRPDLDVQFTSVTEHWAQFAVAGPKSRELLNGMLDVPIDNESFGFMGCGAVSVRGTPGRLFRISFSGEHAYEIAVPARYGASLYRDLVARAEAMDGGAYGMEALNVLRIEKGFITHAEIDGRVTAQDIAMARMISGKKDCIGKDMAARPGMLENRLEMVGLRPVETGARIDAGASLFEVAAAPVRANDQGYVTSVGWSPTFGDTLALGFVRNAHARHGARLTLVDHLRNNTTEVELCHPVFLDPEGGRTRG